MGVATNNYSLNISRILGINVHNNIFLPLTIRWTFIPNNRDLRDS